MKKIAAIFLIAIQLFALTGKLLFIEYCIYQNDISTVNQIDVGNYDAAQLIEVKLPLNVPYYSSSSKYERYYGNVESGGQYYNYVMRKVLNDTVYLLCLANETKSALYKAKAESSSNIAAAETSSPVKKGITPIVKKSAFSAEYFQQNNLFTLSVAVEYLDCREYIFSSALNTGFVETNTKPPEAIICSSSCHGGDRVLLC